MKIIKDYVFIVFIFLGLQSYSQLNSVPENLLSGANSILLNKEEVLRLESANKVKVSCVQKTLVLNELGDSQAKAYLHYDQSVKISKLKVVVDYTNKGRKFKYNSSDFEDASAVDGGTLYSDSRVKFLDITPISYPYVITFEYEYTSNNTAFLPQWIPIRSSKQSVVSSVFQIINTSGSELFVYDENITVPEITKQEDSGAITYKASNLKPLNLEYMSEPIWKILPRVSFGLSNFYLKGVEGVVHNWGDFANWMHQNLLKDKINLPLSTMDEIKALTEGVEDLKDKAKIVYEYMQKKTRYISVQVGIGGWEPIEASKVDALGYGDCKALTNYTRALLAAVDVPSYYTVLYAGNQKRDIREEELRMQGNHAILNIPYKGSDIWLECTNQNAPFGYLGSFTDDRLVMVVKEDEVVFKETNSFEVMENLQSSSISITLNEKGDIHGNLSIENKGNNYGGVYPIQFYDAKKLGKYYKNVRWPYLNKLELLDVSFVDDKQVIAFNEDLEFRVTGYAGVYTNRILLKPVVFGRTKEVPTRYRNRKMTFEISRGFVSETVSTINLPLGYVLEEVMDPVSIETKFGSYELRVSQEDEKIHIYRKLLIEDGVYPGEEYKNYREFIKNNSKNDKKTISVIKK